MQIIAKFVDTLELGIHRDFSAVRFSELSASGEVRSSRIEDEPFQLRPLLKVLTFRILAGVLPRRVPPVIVVTNSRALSRTPSACSTL